MSEQHLFNSRRKITKIENLFLIHFLFYSTMIIRKQILSYSNENTKRNS